MLQIFLAIVGISLAAVLSFSMLERTAAQEIDRDWTENNRRLDMAAEALEASLRTIPGTDAPSPANFVSGDIAVLPAGIGTINQTVSGVPFLYCPIGAVSAAAIGSLPVATRTVSMGDSGSYSVYSYGDAVLASNLAMDNSWSQGPRPLAFIVAAGRRQDGPASCSRVRQVNGQAAIDGGMARAIYSPVDPAHPSQQGSSGASGLTTFWVAPGATGTGRSIDSPGNINAVLRHYLLHNPDRFELIISGVVQPDAALFESWSTSLAHSGATVTLRGATGGAGISLDVLQHLYSSKRMVLANLTLTNIQPRTEDGEMITLLGTVQINTGNYGAWVLAGGKMVMRDATLIGNMEDSSRGVLRLSGELVMFNSTIIPAANNTQNVIYATGEASVMMENSVLGGAALANRPTISAIQMNGAGFFYTDANSRAYQAPGRNCWYSQSQFGTLAPKILIGTGTGLSTVRAWADTDQPPPEGATQAEIDYYETWRQRLWLARDKNVSSAQCIA
ncbi:MAG: hypothetical protein CL949_00465 [Erythrobacter sp.]|nr:hypothetical protein [Erythrobacter sp.]